MSQFLEDNFSRKGFWLANRSLSPTLPRAEFSVRRKYILSPMLVVRRFCGNNTEDVSITAVQNGQRGLAPNR